MYAKQSGPVEGSWPHPQERKDAAGLTSSPQGHTALRRPDPKRKRPGLPPWLVTFHLKPVNGAWPTCLPGNLQLLAIAEGTAAPLARVQPLLCAVVDHPELQLQTGRKQRT